MKFTNKGTITVKVDDERDGMIAISVADTGVGIPSDFRDKLFHTIGLTTTNEKFPGGSGVGLCICRYVNESHQSVSGAALVTTLYFVVLHEKRTIEHVIIPCCCSWL
jgi:signal transduction histidine kinase